MMKIDIIQRCAILAFLLQLNSYALPQGPAFEYLGLESGLRTPNIYHCFQDSQLQLWVASDYGAFKLTRNHFETPILPQQMPDFSVLRIEEDANGFLWFLTMNGIPVRFDGENLRTNWGESFAKKMKGSNYISAFLSLPDGSNIFGTQDGRAFRILSNGIPQFLFASNSGSIQIIDRESDGSICFHFSKVNAIATIKNGVLTHQEFKPLFEHWTRGPLRSTKIGDGRYLYAVENRIAIIRRSGDTLINSYQIQIPEKYVSYVGKDRKDDLWIGTSEGAIKYESNDTLLVKPKRLLEGHFVTSVLKDHEDGIWISTKEGLFHTRDEKIYSITSDSNKPKDLATTIHNSDDGMIYLGFESGRIVQISRHTLQIVASYPNQFLNTNPKIQRILDSPNGGQLVAAYGGLLQLKNGKFSHYASMRLTDFAVREDWGCACLFSGWTQIAFDKGNNWISKLSQNLTDAQSSKASRCSKVAFDQNGVLWIATFGELLRSNGTTIDTIFDNYHKNPRHNITCLVPAGSNRIYIGTTNDGMFIVNNETINRIGKAQGLLDDHIVDAWEDSAGVGWILSSTGLSQICWYNGIPSVTSSRGLYSLFGGASVQDFLVLNDTIWATSGSGFVAFPTTVFSVESNPMHVQITNLSVNQKSTDIEKPLILAYDHNNIRIEFAASSFFDQDVIQYRYRIKNISEQFQSIESQILELPSLSPDIYHIDIQARHIGGYWTGELASLTFEILPPFWKQWWFVVFEIIIGLGIGVVIIMVRTRQIKKRRDLKESLVEAKHNALLNQMNPHFIFNCLNSIQSLLILKDTKSANTYIADFASLMRLILNAGRALRISVSEEIQFLSLYLTLESMRLHNKFEFAFHLSPNIRATKCLIPPMMLQPLIENSVWHGIVPLETRKGVITVSFTTSELYLICSVTDNGVGRERANHMQKHVDSTHESLATTILRERIMLMNTYSTVPVILAISDLEDSEGFPAGTKAQIFIPIANTGGII